MNVLSLLNLGQGALTLEEVADVAIRNRKVELSSLAVEKINTAHAFLLSKIKTGQTFYGVNTGFGLLSNVRIPDDEIESLQYNLLRSHACGMGEPLVVLSFGPCSSYVPAIFLSVIRG